MAILMKAIYTVGHSNRELKEFVEILKSYNISILVDIRRFPLSRKFPHFNKESLKLALERSGIKYVWLGELLGGFRKGGYAKYMETEEFKKGITELMNLIKSENVLAIMCKEKLWFKCHRRFIASALRERGYKVVHIIEKGKAYSGF